MVHQEAREEEVSMAVRVDWGVKTVARAVEREARLALAMAEAVLAMGEAAMVLVDQVRAALGVEVVAAAADLVDQGRAVALWDNWADLAAQAVPAEGQEGPTVALREAPGVAVRAAAAAEEMVGEAEGA